MKKKKFWKELLWEVLLTILTLGLSEVARKKKEAEESKEN